VQFPSNASPSRQTLLRPSHTWPALRQYTLPASRYPSTVVTSRNNGQQFNPRHGLGEFYEKAPNMPFTQDTPPTIFIHRLQMSWRPLGAGKQAGSAPTLPRTRLDASLRGAAPPAGCLPRSKAKRRAAVLTTTSGIIVKGRRLDGAPDVSGSGGSWDYTQRKLSSS
jgi:hypothetical protein